MTDEKLMYLQNQCGIHLVPSETEGFGHSMCESMSCGAVILTTNAPPMNEFIVRSECLIDYQRSQPQFLAVNYTIDPKKLEKCVEFILSCPIKELKKMGQTNRQRYLENKKIFQDNLKKLFGSIHQTNDKTDTAKKTDTSKNTDTAKKTDNSKNTDTAKKTDNSKKTDTAKNTDTSKKTDNSKKINTSKQTNKPKKMKASKVN